MEKLRNLMEAAVREHWQVQPSPGPALEQPPRRTTGDAPAQRKATRPPVTQRAPAIARVPVSAATLARSRLVAALPTSAERQAYCLLQAAVVQRLAETGMRVIGVTGPNASCGKTLTAANLAISLAVDARRPVVLIDLDLRDPGVHTLFDVAPKVAIEDCLFNGAAVAGAMFSPAIDGLAVLPARGSCRAFAEVMRSAHLTALLRKLEGERADGLLVIDLPALASAEDARDYEALVDGIVLVVENDVTRAKDYRRVLQSLDARKLIGTVLNRVAA